MSNFISERLFPEDGDGWLWSCCQNCQHQKDCPYVFDQILLRAACQGRSAAQFLTAEADRLMETISCAEDISHLLKGDEALEHVLSHVLCSEMTLIDSLCLQTVKYCGSTSCEPVINC